MFKNTFNTAFILCLTAILFGCGGNSQKKVSASSNAKIINGTEQDQLSSPQILKISINYTDGTSGFCSGTVIGVNSVLTAGHCFYQGGFAKGARAAFVTTPAGLMISADEVYIHPGFNIDVSLGAIFNDLAIIKVSEPLNLPVLGILASRQPETGSIVGVYGYGLDEDGNAGVLKSGTMQIDTVTENHLMATYDDLSNTCNGDSGGPVTYSINDAEGQLVSVAVAGIISSGSVENCEKGDVNLFTNLSSPSSIGFISSLVPEVSLQ